MTIRLAFAVNHNHVFEQKHFGEADQYLVYEWAANELIFREALPNPFAQLSRNNHSEAKRKQITELLQQHEVNVLVSRQFGENISKVNAFFVPVLVETSSPAQLILILKKQMRWIEEEWRQNAGNYKLFKLQKGTIKTSINPKK